MSKEEVTRECMALLWPLRRDDGTYLFDDCLAGRLIHIAYIGGEMDGSQAAYTTAQSILDGSYKRG